MTQLRLNRHALGGLVGRYGDIFRHAWTQRRQNDTPLRLAHELVFLPANLELTETPPHPAPRLGNWILWPSRRVS